MNDLSVNSKGEAVRRLQKGLIAFTQGPHPLAKSDGYFGEATKAALIQYQKENHIPATGVYDARTQSELQAKLDYMFITLDDVAHAAESMKVHPAALKAVYTVESKGDGFLPGALPVILYEGHIFYRLYKAKYGEQKANRLASQYPSLVYPTWTRIHYRGGVKEHERLEMAKALHEEIAIQSTSYGLFQVMGFNCKVAGYRDAFAYQAAMCDSERHHLKAGCNFIRSNESMHLALRKCDWPIFARLYNGPDYIKNNYHLKLHQAYNQFVAQ